MYINVIDSLQVIRSLKRALQPAVTDVSVQFKVPKEYTVLQSPQKLPPIFNGEKVVVYGIVKSNSDLKKRVDCTAVLKGNVLGKSQKHEVPFTLEPLETPNLATAHHLAAKALIMDWENENKDKKSIVKLSVEASVISSHTAFIAVDEESSEAVAAAMKIYEITAKDNSSTNFLCFYDSDDSLGFDSSVEEEEMEELSLAHTTTKISKCRVNAALSADLSEEEREDAKAKKKHFEGRKKNISSQVKSEDVLLEGELDYELASWSEGEGQE